ncbi:HNH endonuclease [uncultured Planococcus sp.]|uniref:HNH endonuclease n=1 Tax=uncultured Planococcus sp. TaxID=337815 RepID=UPI00260342B1|nr:HNH endonuclease [uncultured Planococcus sp.]
MTIEIPLTQGKVAIIDAEDYALVSKYKWCFSSSIGYAVSRHYVDGIKKPLLLHRLIMNAPAHLVTDHINRIPLDNRKQNLRLCTKAENNRNMPVNRKNNKSGYKGVYFSKARSKWVANIRKDDKSIYLGIFESKNDAARMYNFWAVDMFGEYANLNIINEDVVN